MNKYTGYETYRTATGLYSQGEPPYYSPRRGKTDAASPGWTSRLVHHWRERREARRALREFSQRFDRSLQPFGIIND